MKQYPHFVTAALAALGMGSEMSPESMKMAARLMEPRQYCRRGRGKSKGGRGGSGLLKRRQIRKLPAGYGNQTTPVEHMHSAARRRALATA